MKRAFRLSSAALFLLALGTWVGAAEPKEKKISARDLPPAVTAAFKKAYPNAVINGCSQEEEDGGTCYEVESLDGKQGRDLIYATDGTVLEMEERIPPEELPAAVKKALAERSPKGKILGAEKLTKGHEVTYEVKMTAKGHAKQVKFNEKGEEIATEHKEEKK